MKFTFVFMAVIFALGGCASTPTASIEAFGVSASGVTEKIDAMISDYNQANVNDKLVTMAQTNKKYVRSSFDPIKKVIIRNSDKKNFALYKANKALGDYAGALVALARAGSSDEVSMAAVRLSASLKSMNEQYKTLKDTDKDILKDDTGSSVSRIISEISTFHAQNKRAKALKRIIVSSDEQIQVIGKVINDQLLSGVIEGRLYTVRGNELAGYFADYNAIASTASFSEKKKALENIYSLYVEMESSGATVAQARKAITSVMKAHAKLKSELEKDRFGSKAISSAVSEIKSAHNGFDDLQELLMTCDTEIISDDEKGIICKEK